MKKLSVFWKEFIFVMVFPSLNHRFSSLFLIPDKCGNDYSKALEKQWPVYNVGVVPVLTIQAGKSQVSWNVGENTQSILI